MESSIKKEDFKKATEAVGEKEALEKAEEIKTKINNALVERKQRNSYKEGDQLRVVILFNWPSLKVQEVIIKHFDLLGWNVTFEERRKLAVTDVNVVGWVIVK